MPLHPVIERMLETQRDAKRPSLSSLPVAEARALFSSTRPALGEGPEIGSVEDIAVSGRSGAIDTRLYRPERSPRGLIVYLHGGGWVVGALADFDTLARTLVARTGCALLLVDYRLAPEHPFPAGLEDSEDAILWTASPDAASRGFGGLPLIVAGDSAGGNLAAVCALTLRGRVEVALQVLFNPVADVVDTTESYALFGTALPLTSVDMGWFLSHYAPRELWSDPRIAPLRQSDLAGAPAAWIGTAEFDLLRDEGEAYARKLEAAGVAVELRRYEGVAHGYVRMMNLVDTADRALDDAAQAIVRAASVKHRIVEGAQ